MNGNSNGRNTFNLTVSGAADGAIASPAALLSNIQTINVRNVTTGASTLTVNAATFTGTTAINSDRSGQTVTITNLATGASAGQIGNGTVTNGALNFGYATGSAAATLNVSGGTIGTGAIAVTSAATALTINSTGTNVIGAVTITSGATNRVTAVNINADTKLTLSSLSDDFAAGGTLTVSGAATNVTLGTAPATLEVVNAAGLTAGGITMTIGNTASVITGGAGADTITTGGTQTGAVSGGAGTADRLIVATAGDVAATPAAKFSNFEILQNDTNTDLDMSLFTASTFTSIAVKGGGGAAKMTATQAANITNLDNSDTLTFSLAAATGTSDVLSVTLNNATATTSADLTTTTVTGFETVNIVSSSGTKDDISSVSFAAAGDLTALNLSGARPVTVATGNITKAAAINASSMTYAGTAATDYTLTLSGDLVKGSSVVGSNQIDKITATAAITGIANEYVTYDAGAGNDLVLATVAAINNNGAGNGSLKISGGVGTDTLQLTDAGGVTLVDANFQYITNIETLVASVADTAISITTGGFFNANFGANTPTTLTLGEATNSKVNTLNAVTATGNLTVTLTAGETTTAAQTVSTGSGVDSVTITAAKYTGANNGIAVSTGDGADTISIGATAITGVANAINVTGGKGADTISVAATTGSNASTFNFVTFTYAAGDSTVAAFDSVTGYFTDTAGNVTRYSDKLDVTGTATVQGNAAATGVTGYTADQLTYSITNGVISFAGTSAAALTVAQKGAIVTALITVDTASVVFNQTNADTTVDAYVFNNNDLGDNFIRLVGVTADLLSTTNTVSTAGDIYII